MLTSQPFHTSFQSDGDPPLWCATCKNIVGRVDSSSGGYKLRKAHLAVSPTSADPPHSHTFEKWCACLILTATESQGVRKIMITDGKRALKVWLFTPDLNVSSSAAESPEPMRVAKILWQDCDAGLHAGDCLSEWVMTEGELTLESGEFSMVRDILESTVVLIPEGARNFQGWKVALLRSFTASDLGTP